MTTDMFIFPDYFKTGVIPEAITERELVADLLSAWGCVMAGAPPPPKFGYVMSNATGVLGFSPTPENLLSHADKFSK